MEQLNLDSAVHHVYELVKNTDDKKANAQAIKIIEELKKLRELLVLKGVERWQPSKKIAKNKDEIGQYKSDEQKN